MINFSKLIKDIQKQGMTQVEIASYVGCAQSNISAILNQGNEPKFGLGSDLIALHLSLVSK